MFVDSKYEEFWSGRYERTWFDFLPIGWQKRFGMKLVHDIDKYLKDNNITNYHIDDVKQMFGMLYKNRPVKNTKSSALCMKQDIC